MKKEETKKKFLTVADEALNELQPIAKNTIEKIGVIFKEEILKGIDLLFNKGKNTIKNKMGTKEGTK